MEYLRLERVSKSYGHKLLMDDINLTISRGDKLALIAKNGSGKSTLLRIICGQEPADGERSRVLLNNSIRTSYLPQDPDFEENLSISETIIQADIASLKAIRAYESALETGEQAVIQKAITRVDDLDAWDIESKVKEVLFKLGLRDLDQKVLTLSGGQKKRLALARIILANPDFIVLDEPTNHLDIEMIEWLEDYLRSASLTLLMVTHDRYFMERVCNWIIELDKGHLFKFNGNYSQYLEKKSLRSEQDAVMLEKAKKLYLKELEWMRRQPQARGTKEKSRISEYHKLKEQISSIQYDEVFQIAIDAARLGKKIVEFYDTSKSFGKKVIVKNYSYKFKNGEKVGISGPNGCGKTTFIKLITGEEPIDLGKRVIGETVQFGHYNQEGMLLEEDKRVIDVIRDVAEFIPLKKGQRLSAERLLEKFMFEREQQEVYVSQLSGGERKRLLLLRILMSNPNFLILDEPTNDLDVLTLNVLENYLHQFPGCVIIVSHDRYFMDKLVDHMFIFGEDGRIEDFNGSYSEWKRNYKPARPKKLRAQVEESAKDELPSSTRKLSYLEKQEMTRIEERIQLLEKRKEEISALFSDPIIETSQIKTYSIELGQIKNELDEIEMRWLELSEFH